MKNTRLLVALVFLFVAVSASAFGQSELVKPAAHTPASSAALETPSIVYIELDDVSGSMGSFIDAVRKSAADQLRKLKPGDVLARIEFDAEARLVSLTPVREGSDIENALAIDLGPADGKRTEVSRGLIRARQLMATLANTDRRIVLVLATDAKLQPKDTLAEEHRRLTEVATWWKSRSDAVIVMVAPSETVRTSTPFVELAKQLHAQTVGLEEFQKNAIVTRKIEALRPTAKPFIPTPSDTSSRPNLIAPVAAALIVLAVGFAALRLRQLGTVAPSGDPLERAPGPRPKAHVVVTTAGATREIVVEIRPDDAEGAMTIGGAGTAVELAGYRGRLPITVSTSDGIAGDVRVPEGITALMGADRIDTQSGPVHFVGRTALKTAGAHIQIRLEPEGAAS